MLEWLKRPELLVRRLSLSIPHYHLLSASYLGFLKVLRKRGPSFQFGIDFENLPQLAQIVFVYSSAFFVIGKNDVVEIQRYSLNQLHVLRILQIDCFDPI